MTNLFWGASFVGGLVLAILMYRKGLHSEYRFFFAYIVAHVASDFLGFVFYRISYKAYFIGYWAGALSISILGFCLIYEVFNHIFRPYESLREFGTVLFRWSALVLLLIGSVMMVSSGIASPIDALQNLALILDRSVQLMQCGLVLFMYLFGIQFGLTERHRIFGIVIGLGLIASIRLVCVTLIAVFSSHDDLLSLPYQLACLLSIGIWTVYMIRPEPVRRRATILEKTESWNYALAGISNTNNSSPFLPGVVDTVDKVFNKRVAEAPAGLDGSQ